MKAMVFAAGIGSRLRPLTLEKPKALVEVGGRPVIEHVLRHLDNYGCRDIIINLHHFPEQVKKFLEENNNFGLNLTFSEESELLDTGGGLKKASWFFGEKPFILYNADILSNLNINNLVDFHNMHDGLATLVVRQRKSSRYLLLDENKRLLGWEDSRSNYRKMPVKITKFDRFAFSGIHVLDPYVFQFFPGKKKFSIIDFYLNLIKSHRIYGFIDHNSYWFDIGTIEKLQQADDFFRRMDGKEV
ncbi:MAG: NDP-sugar synthase [Bacteroidales bacterium]